MVRRESGVGVRRLTPSFAEATEGRSCHRSPNGPMVLLRLATGTVTPLAGVGWAVGKRPPRLADAADGAVEVLGVGGGGAGDGFVDDVLFGGGDEVAEEGTVLGGVAAVEVVAEFSVILFADPLAGGAFVEEVFEGDEETAVLAGEELLGEDADEVHGEEAEGALAVGGLEEVDEALDGVVDA